MQPNIGPSIQHANPYSHILAMPFFFCLGFLEKEPMTKRITKNLLEGSCNLGSKSEGGN